ncbi:FecR family protein [Niabella drilacis]|uniref:FecR family protein n=1 Tax=Niabella drilacis (strain DSM 25811 / CCM 8410 / CCUG 62505 / LMG 26954 / E90) TaxID=1285928 RepID=A0A1G7BIZ7_NIADE|nr:FecR family protein [Niabella drilacis]SDE27044.1 FecR family protein [Niabella drilacis]
MQTPLQAIEHYLKGTATDEEIRLVNDWYYSFDDSAITVSPGNEQLRDLVKQRIYSRLDQTLDLRQRTVMRYRAGIRWAAAILLPLVVAAGVYWSFPRTKPVASSLKAENSPVVPGGNHAVLTLENGQQILLDSAEVGTVASQGGMQVLKSAEGRLVYKVNDQGTSTGGVMYNTITTPRGGQYEVVLADGTKVWLNSASSLRFPTSFRETLREVSLTGEGYFEVVHVPVKKGGAYQPFVVSVNAAMKVTVFGTKFNIMGYTNEAAIKTTLMEGSIEASVKNSKVKVSPGRQAILERAGTHFSLEHADMNEVLAWKNNEFRFHNLDIKGIMRQLERWYNIETEYVGKVDHIHLSGVIPKTENIRNLLEILETTGKITFSIKGNRVVLRAA